MNTKKLMSALVGGVLLGAVLSAPAAWAGIGSGALTVNNDNTSCSSDTLTGSFGWEAPKDWDVAAGQGVHLNVNAAWKVCTSGRFTGHTCTSDAQCSTKKQPGVCSASPQLKCSGATSVFIEGSLNEGPCTGGLCVGNSQACVTDHDCVVPFEYTLSATSTGSTIDVCYTTQSLMCGDADVAYCNQQTLVNNSVNGKIKGKGKGRGMNPGIGPSDLQAVLSLGSQIDCP